MSSHHLSDLDYSFFPFNNDLILLSLQETPEMINYYQYQYTPQSHLLEESFSNSSPPRHLMENLSISQEITRLSSALGTINNGTDTMGKKGRMGPIPIPNILDQDSRKIRRVCSTGDLQGYVQKMKGSETEMMMMMVEEGSLKIGRCGAEERKEKIQKYRAKRMHRNFNKTIKYVCRKTLANNRSRIRGRFARNNEVINIPNSTTTGIYGYH